ncbi:MAG: zinc-ribbon domain-containing protein [Lachnospiraceae bacterium]
METKKTQTKRKFVSLAEARPDLVKEWNYEKNGDLKPEDVSCGSNKKVWWKLPYDVPDDYPVEHLRGKHFEFEWEAAISNRIKGRKCPFLSGKAIWKEFNDLQTVNPKLAAQWHPTKNGDLKPTQFTANAGKKVWWLLSYNVPMNYPVECLRGKHFEFEWLAMIKQRNNGNDCPYLTGQAIWPGFNDLTTVNPELACQWHPTKNGDLKPTQVTANTTKKVWWISPYDVPMNYPVKFLRGKHFDFEWEAMISSRNKGAGCPFLVGQAVWPGFNDLQTVNPELAKQWHPTKNGILKPTEVTCGATKKVWWIFPYDDPETGRHHDFEWQASIQRRNHGSGCPYLSHQTIRKGFNDLQTVNPELAKQWHPTKNGILKPTEVTANSDKKVWWLFRYSVPNDYPVESLRGKYFVFEWVASIGNRNKNSGCPYLSGQAVWSGFNDLTTVNPELAAQWHPTKNGDLKPTQVAVNSDKKVWWLFRYSVPNDYPVESLRGKHFEFEWVASIGNRNKNSGCPYLTGHKICPGFNDLATVNPELAAQWHPAKNGDLKPIQFTANSNQKVWWLLPYDDPHTGKHFNFEWEALICDRNGGNNCPYLTTYKGEEYIKKYLQKNSIAFNVQQKFSDLFGTGNRKLSYDFAIPDAKSRFILIEYNGIQHYKSYNFFGGEKKFKIQKEHDRRKREYAKQHGYKLITIKYTYDTYEKVAEYLDKHLPKEDCKRTFKKAA